MCGGNYGQRGNTEKDCLGATVLKVPGSWDFHSSGWDGGGFREGGKGGGREVATANKPAGLWELVYSYLVMSHR